MYASLGVQSVGRVVVVGYMPCILPTVTYTMKD